MNDPINFRNGQLNQPMLFSTGNQIPTMQPQTNYGFQPNNQYFQPPTGLNNINQPIWTQNSNIGVQPMALQKALMDKSALWKFKNSLTQDIGDWIFTMERHFRRMQEIYANITDRHKVDCAVDYLRDSALSVYKDLENSNEEVTWEKLKKALKETFQPFDQDRLVEEKLKKLKQTKTVDEYISDFHDLACKTQMTEKEKIKLFIEGLKDKAYVGYERPKTLAEAKELARKRELYFDEPMKKHQAYERMRDIGYYETGRYLDRMTRNRDYQSHEARSQSVNNYDNKNNQFYSGSKRPYMNNSPTKKFNRPYQNEGRFNNADNNYKGQLNNNSNQYDNQYREQNNNLRQGANNIVNNQQNNSVTKTVKDLKIICYRCKQEGHIAPLCPHKNNKPLEANDKGNKTSVNLIMDNIESTIKEGNLNYAYPKMNMAMGNEDSLIYVTGTIYNDYKFNKCEMVLDTGATSSGIAQRIVEKLNIPVKNNSKNSINIKLADGTTAYCKMTEKVKIIVNGRECEIEFFIVPHNEIEILLGIDWMRAMEASVHPSSKQVLRFPEKIIKWNCEKSKTVWGTVTIEEKKISKKVLFQVRPDMEHSSVSEEVIKILGWNNQDLEFLKQWYIMEEPLTIRIDDFISRVNFQINEDETASIYLGRDWIKDRISIRDNMGTKELVCLSSNVGCTLKQREDEDKEIYISELMAEEEDFQEQMHWFEDGKELKLSENLTEEQKKKVTKFLFENDAAFANDYQQLGECTISEHKIKLTTDIPIYQFPYRKSLSERKAMQEEVDKTFA